MYKSDFYPPSTQLLLERFQLGLAIILPRRALPALSSPLGSLIPTVPPVFSLLLPLRRPSFSPRE